MSADDDSVDEGLFEVCEENTHFQTVFEQHGTVQSFLSRTDTIYARSVTAETVEQEVFLQFSTDVDGCVVEFKSWKCIKMPVRHLTLCHKNMASVREMKSMLKKHVQLAMYSKEQMKMFNHCVGFQLFYEAGWEGWIGVIPTTNKRGPAIDRTVMKDVCYKYFQTIKAEFQKRLLRLRDTALRRTLMKNDLNDISKLVILPDDCHTIFSELQKSIDDCHLHADYEPISFCFRFGEKAASGVSLNAFDADEIKRCTVHAAMDISAEYMNLMWSMAGLQKVVGGRGVLNTCLSFNDCGNYQSSLDGRLVDVCNDLRSVCIHPDQLRFVQLYADTPHIKPRTRFHPVSGVIAGGMVFAKETTAAFARDANHYISALETNYVLMGKSTCRLEVVTEVGDLKDVIQAEDCLNVDKVFTLLVKHPLIVPFPCGMMQCIQTIGRWITVQLRMLLAKFSRTGNVEATWKAYQLELAAEKMLWGHPLCFRSNIYSVNLGPGVLEASRSVTDDLGFLTLERWTACMATDESIPPCRIWTGSEMVASKIVRTVGIHDVLEASSFVVGRKLIDAIITDFYEVGKVDVYMRIDEFKQQLFSDKPTRYKIAGAVTLKQLVHLLSARRRVAHAMVFRVLCQLVERSKHDLASTIRDGFTELGLKYFPALQARDTHNNAVLNWSSQSGLYHIIGTEDSAHGVRQSAMVLTQLITAELEMRHLVYVSKLKTVLITFPWIGQCARKLSNAKLCEDDLVRVLTFISCIGLLMNGWYVDFAKMETLLKSLPVDQYRLRDLEIQSKLLMSYFNKFKLFRLHHSIPIQMRTVNPEPTSTKGTDSTPQPAENMDHARYYNEPNNRITDDDNVGSKHEVSMRAATCVPVCVALTKERWSANELELLHDIVNIRQTWQGVAPTMKQLYDLFKQKCIDNRVPFRTRKSFEHKLKRI